MNYLEAKVLVVDDNEDLRQLIVHDLNQKFLKTLQACNGNEAIEIIKMCKVHVVVSDIQMPNGDGLQLLKAIREIDPEIPIFFFITGSSFANEVAVSMGARKVFFKPFNRDDLIEEVLKSISELN